MMIPASKMPARVTCAAVNLYNTDHPWVSCSAHVDLSDGRRGIVTVQYDHQAEAVTSSGWLCPLDKEDGRMTPEDFEARNLQPIADWLRLVFGHLWTSPEVV